DEGPWLRQWNRREHCPDPATAHARSAVGSSLRPVKRQCAVALRQCAIASEPAGIFRKTEALGMLHHDDRLFFQQRDGSQRGKTLDVERLSLIRGVKKHNVKRRSIASE